MQCLTMRKTAPLRQTELVFLHFSNQSQMLATRRMMLRESTVCSNKGRPTASWLFWKAGHMSGDEPGKFLPLLQKRFLKNHKKSNAVQLSQSEIMWWSYNKGHIRWDTATQKLFIKYATYSILKHSHDFNIYIQMFFLQVVDSSCQNKKTQMISSLLPSEKCLVNAMTGLFLSLNARYTQLNVKKTLKVNLSSYFCWITAISY